MTDAPPPSQPGFDPAQGSDQPYKHAVADYAQAGWPGIIPVPPTTKSPPPSGYTGAEGRDTDPLQLVRFATEYPHYAVALRMPMFTDAPGSGWAVIGIDVDQYAKTSTLPDGTTKTVHKRGAETLAVHEQQWGPLPPTWTSTARGSAEGPGVSAIRFYRVPAQRYATVLATPETSDVEIIQHHHRYAVVWPSRHKDAGVYCWYDPQGRPSPAPPKPVELPELPATWVTGLAEGASAAGPPSAAHADGRQLLDQLLEDWQPECADITSARMTASADLQGAESGSRHDVMTARIHHLVQIAAQGHTGVAWALNELREVWSQITAGEDRLEEFERMLLSSARKAVSVVGLQQVPRDPCLLVAGFATPPDSPPGSEPDPDLALAEPPRWLSTREVIGVAAFDPNAGTDQSLAEKVLERTYPALRHAYDSKGWLLRAPDRWELFGDLSSWAVAQVAPLMPVGDPTAEKGSEQLARHQRRSRLMSNAGARAVAGKMASLVAGGMHPAAIALSKLDAEPEILWAGGIAWDLRASGEEPTPAQIDPATPHLRTAAVVPQAVPTPLWDAFLESVWPEPDVRAWAMRVLSISVSGYADRALPILLGETGRGKTQVLALMMSVLGSYAHAANPKLLSANTNEHDTIVFDLKGRRLSFIDEAPSEAKAGQERLKQLTGGGELTGRQMNQDPITFVPSHTFVLTSNDEPVLTDPAVRSRTRLIPCAGDPEAVRLTRAAIGHFSGPAWKAEAPGVLAKLMAEVAGWLDDPTTGHTAAAPEHIRYLAENFGAEQDPVTVWVAEETEPFDQGTPSRELYQAFTASCLRNNLRRDAIPSETKWGRSLTRLGYPSASTGRHKVRRLRVRMGGFLPGMEPLPGLEGATRQSEGQIQPSTPAGPETAAPAAGLDGSTAGFVPGSNPQPGNASPQVNPSDSVDTAGFAGLSEGLHTHAHTHTHRNDDPDFAANPAVSPSAEPVSEPPAPKRKTKPRSAGATAKAAVLREEKRQAAIAEAAGEQVTLPAVLLRDGTLRHASTSDADALLATITTGEHGELTVDVEHTGYPLGHEHFTLRTVQLGGESFAVVLDPSDPEQAAVVRRHMAAAPILHAHSATADLVPLADADLLGPDGLDGAWERMHDTVVLAKLADPASTGSDPGLKEISAAMLGTYGLSAEAEDARKVLFKAGKWLTDTEATTPIERSGWAQVDPTCSTMVRYAASDVLDDAAIAARLPQPEPALLERERTVQRMTARVAHRGLRIDGEHVQRLLGEHTAARSTCAERVREISAGAIENPGSNPQVGQALADLGAPLPRTATGKPSVAKTVLEPLRSAEGTVGDLARAVLDYRHHDTAIGTFLEPYHQLVHNGDGRARPTVYTLGADTGRMSCVRPNLQQVPREGGFRSCITADPGHLLVSADFANVELRVAAALSQDTGLMAMLGDGVDFHWMVARQAWGPNATKADRYTAKRGVFGRIYGGGVPTLAAQMAVSEPVAQQVVDALDALTPGLSEWSRMVRENVKHGLTKFPTYSGRTVHLPPEFPHKAPNYCIQGTARELLVDALIGWSKTRWSNATLLPVHDEVVVMVPEDEAEQATAALVEVMGAELHGVRIVAEASEPSYAWSDAA